MPLRGSAPSRRPRVRGGATLLAFASGVVFAASTPPVDLVAGILVGLAGFAFASDETRPRTGALRGWAFGLGANLLALRFVPQVIGRYTDLPVVAAWTALLLLAAAQALLADERKYMDGVRCPQCDQLRLELGEARKDAERYRWIKATRYEHDPDDDPDSAWAKAWDEIEGMVGATGDIDSAIDRAIDAAAEGK